eukprot:5780421-Heterocapsa_arctica.AAC.1
MFRIASSPPWSRVESPPPGPTTRNTSESHWPRRSSHSSALASQMPNFSSKSSRQLMPRSIRVAKR